MPHPTKAIVLVHGRGYQDDKPVLKQRWVEALRTRCPQPFDADEDVFLAYYRDEFYGPPPTGTSAGTTLASLAAANPAADEDVKVLRHLMARFQQEYVTTTGVAAAAAPSLPPESEEYIFDILRYFGDDSFYNRVNGHLIQALRDAGDRQKVLIAHSMGSIVAYEVVAGGDIEVDTLVTIGCPISWSIDLQSKIPDWLEDRIEDVLSIPARFRRSAERIRKRASEVLGRMLPFTAAATRLHRQGLKIYPPKVGRWYNIYDPQDPVAFLRAPLVGLPVPSLSDPNCGDDFRMEDGSERVFDIVIRNPERPHYHSGAGYLKSWQVGQIVSDFWTRP